jgi:cobalt-zinc-cadmium efflux system membrane fusion protein
LNINYKRFSILAALTVIIVFSIAIAQEPNHTKDNHDHSAQPTEAEHKHENCSHTSQKHEPARNEQDDHSGHDHSSHAHSGTDCENDTIELNPQQTKFAEIKLAKAGPGSLNKTISLSGEVTLNSDSLINHSSRASGIVVEIKCSAGDYVRKGDILAVIDSAELGQAKSEFYEIFNEVGCCLIDLNRFRTVAGNTGKLLTTLEKNPEISSLQQIKFGDMSDYGASLLKSYAEYVISGKTFRRKEKLFKEKILSENEFLNAQNGYEKAMAEYFATRDNARFELKQKLLDLERLVKVSEFKLRTAERRLQLLGLSTEEINQIRAHGAAIQESCTDPDCKDCVANGKNHSHLNEDPNFSKILIKAGRSGIVTFRDVNPGEEVESNKTIFTVADTSNLWAILQASLKDFSLIEPGMQVTMQAPNGTITIGRVLLVSPVVNEQTRTISVRVALNNEERKWLPGSFLTGKITIAEENLAVVINRNAVQQLNGQNVVFVPGEHGYRIQPVLTGRQDDNKIEIKTGIEAGQEYVSEGAFALKSVKLTSTMDSHAGHGH